LIEIKLPLMCDIQTAPMQSIHFKSRLWSNGMQILLREHASLTAMLQSLLLMIDRGPRDAPEAFFDVMRSMLFYIDEFPEKEHHPKESDVLFPRVARLSPGLFATIEKLEHDHMRGEQKIHELQHALLAWEILGESRMAAFTTAARDYVAFYRNHMRLEEKVVVPAALAHFLPADWVEIDAAFGSNRDILGSGAHRDPAYDRLFSRIVTAAPAPIGVGASGEGAADL